jgi:hypothetical protein
MLRVLDGYGVLFVLCIQFSMGDMNPGYAGMSTENR